MNLLKSRNYIKKNRERVFVYLTRCSLSIYIAYTFNININIIYRRS